LEFTDDISRVDMSDWNSQALTDSERKVLALFRLEGMFQEMDTNLKLSGTKVKTSDKSLLHLIAHQGTKNEDIAII
jgi:hypothetical protein